MLCEFSPEAARKPTGKERTMGGWPVAGIFVGGWFSFS